MAEGYKKTARQRESGGDDKAISKGNAKGRYQFTGETWRGLGFDEKDIFNPEVQELAMTKFTEQNADSFRRRFGKEPTEGDLYGMHHMGAKGYIATIEKPNAPVTQYYGEKAMKANPHFSKMGTMGNLGQWMRNYYGGDSETELSNSSQQVKIGSGNIGENQEKNYLPSEMFNMQGDSSHIRQIELPEVTEAKKDILTNEIVKNIEANNQGNVPNDIVVEETASNPTYNYLQQTELFQL